MVIFQRLHQHQNFFLGFFFLGEARYLRERSSNSHQFWTLYMQQNGVFVVDVVFSITQIGGRGKLGVSEARNKHFQRGKCSLCPPQAPPLPSSHDIALLKSMFQVNWTLNWGSSRHARIWRHKMFGGRPLCHYYGGYVTRWGEKGNKDKISNLQTVSDKEYTPNKQNCTDVPYTNIINMKINLLNSITFPSRNSLGMFYTSQTSN